MLWFIDATRTCRGSRRHRPAEYPHTGTHTGGRMRAGMQESQMQDGYVQDAAIRIHSGCRIRMYEAVYAYRMPYTHTGCRIRI